MATVDLNFTPPDPVVEPDDHNRYLIENFELIADDLTIGDGISGTFTTVDGKTITVTDGKITAIV